MSLRFVIFLLLLTLTLAGLSALVYKRVTTAFDLSQRARIALVALLAGGVVLLFGGRVFARLLGDSVAAATGAIGGTIMVGVIVTAAALMVERAAAGTWHGGVWLLKKLGRAKPANVAAESSPTRETAAAEAIPARADNRAGALTRRELVAKAAVGAAVTVGSGSALYGTLFGRHDYAIEEVPMRLSALPPSLDGFSIVQLSDIHLGAYVGEREVRSAIELVARAKPDLIVLTGDLLDHDYRYAELLGSLTRRLSEHAQVAAIAGNHDYYAGLGPTVSALKRAGAEVLMNRSVSIGDRGPPGARFTLAGVDDMWARRFGGQRGPDVEAALRGADPELAKVLLCHNPAYFPEAAPHVDLQLSGHTHGGQFNLGIRPADYVLPFGYVAGRYQRGDGQLYVNRGFGTAGPPARLGAPPEVTKIILTV